MSPVVVSQVGTNVILTLTAPNSNGATITAYSVFIMDGVSSSFVNATSSCAESSSTLLSTKTCTVSMSVIRSTYHYALGQLIEAESQAQNSVGWS